MKIVGQPANDVIVQQDVWLETDDVSQCYAIHDDCQNIISPDMSGQINVLLTDNYANASLVKLEAADASSQHLTSVCEEQTRC